MQHFSRYQYGYPHPCSQGLPDTLSGGDLTSLQHQQQPQHQPQQQQQQLPAQFYGSGIYSGAASYHPGANAAFQAVPPNSQFEAPQMPGAILCSHMTVAVGCHLGCAILMIPCRRGIVQC